MKNLSAIPRLSLFAAYTILITLVVCLAGFAGTAEAHLQYNQGGQNFNGNDDDFYRSRQSQEETANTGSYSQRSSKVEDDDFTEQQRNFASYLDDIPLDMIMKRDFDESDGFDSDRENDGYGYDDDEYYHFNSKRNDDASKKCDKEGVKEVTNTEKLNSQLLTANKAQNENSQKESKTIEMLNYKEMHPNLDLSHPSGKNTKPYAYQDVEQKKSLTSEPGDTLKISDLKENSALGEKSKGGKEEVRGVLSSPNESKVGEGKKGAKITEAKENSNLKESEMGEVSEKKDKELGLQDKNSLSSKDTKESVKSADEKEKIENDGKNVKLSEGMDKIGKSKEEDTAKITKEDKDNSRFYDRLNSEIISSNDFSRLNNRVNLVSSDYKENLEQMKRSRMEEDEKDSEELGENNRNVNLNDYSDELRERKDILKNSEYGNNYGVVANNGDDSYSEMVRDFGRSEFFGIPVAYEIRSDPREFFQKRELWRDHARTTTQDPNEQLMYMSSAPKDNYRLNLPKSELENTEYHKNYLKSLRRYKASENTKGITIPSSNEKNPRSDKYPAEPYQKRSKTKRGSLSYGDFDDENIIRDKFGNDHLKIRRNACANGDLFAREPHLNFDDDRRESQLGQQHNTRHRRKSQKLDVRTFNQDSLAGDGFSKLTSIKRKKEIKKKLRDQTEGNAVRQNPYSQVSKIGQFNSDRKIKRKAPLWKRREEFGDYSHDSDTTARNKGVPIGYYSNRVKFGQKVVNRNDGGQDAGTGSLNEINQFTSLYEKSPIPGDKSWTDSRIQNWKHDPSKRYDEKEHSSNPLLLVKKDKNGDRLAKAFTDVNSKSEGDEELSSDQLAKMLSKDSDYVILKKKDKNKFQKLNDNQGSLEQSNSLNGFDSHETFLYADSVKSDKSKLASQHESGLRSDRGLFIRSYHPDEENKKFSSNKLHSSAKSNLRKTFEKFKDLANLFRDNEQDSSDNQRQSSEAKVGGEIVFSEDRMPDPIVISNDANGKLEGFKSKSSHSISSISNNFKTLDQNKNTNGVKEDDSSRNRQTENTESSWEPALKNAFPEAKSINSVQKNGNEIIVLDFNRNRLKPGACKMLDKQSQPIGSPQPSNTIGSLSMGDFSGSDNSYGNIDPAGFFIPSESSGMYQQGNSLTSQGDRQVEVILHEGVLPTFLQNDNTVNKPGETIKTQPLTTLGSNGAYAIFSGYPNEGQLTIPIYSLTTPTKNSMYKKPNLLYSKPKSITKKNSEYIQPNDLASNVNQLMKDFKELSKLYQTHDSKGTLGNVYSNDVPSSNSDNKLKFLRNLLQSIISNKAGEDNPDTGTHQNDNVELDQNAYQKPDFWTDANVAYETDPTSKRQGKWTSAVGRKSDYNREYVPDEAKQDISKLLQSEGFKTTDEDQYQNGLWEELSEASDKIQRLRREGADKGKLKKTIEDALSYRERRQSESEKKETSDSKTGESDKKLESNVNAEESKSKMTSDTSAAASFKNDKNTDGKSNAQAEPQMKGDNKESDESKRSVTKSESQSTDISPKDQLVDPNKSGTKGRKRRRKRSLDVKNRVSTADIQNEILKKLAEDTYQSVYSSGIRRKLLSIQDDEDADNYINPTGNDEELVTGETQLQSVNDPINSGVDPTILTLFDSTNGENEKSRARRSLNSAFHSNYKREIDLDESMPNDFQNFLVTSLSGFGSQKREVVKKEEALWEGKENSQDNFNQIADSSQGGKDSNEDSPLEKRDVSKSEKHRHESFRDNNNYLSDGNGKEISRIKSADSHSRKKVRSQDKSKTSGFEEDKNPTHIRIQVTNASVKEKKSSKPIMDESENTSTEMENLPKEKEFLDKNKVRVNKAQKVYSLRDPKLTSSNSIRLEEQNPSNGLNQKVYYDTHPNRKRKKKKYVEESGVKTIKSFTAFDQKAMDSLLKKYFMDQNSFSITTQRMPVGSHLPQVETVYNPAQGANKAQLHKYRVSSLKGNSKTSANSKNSLKSDSFDADVLRSYFQNKRGKAKSEKENVKSYIDSDWKPMTGKSKLSFNSDQDILSDIRIPKLKTFDSSFPSTSIPTENNYFPQTFDRNSQTMWSQRGMNYMNRRPSSNALFDALKLKQEMQPFNNFDRDGSQSKSWSKLPYGSENVYNKPDDRTPYSVYNHLPGEVAWNHGDIYSKNQLPQKYKTKDPDGNNMRGISKQKLYDSILKLKGSEMSKHSRLGAQPLYPLDSGNNVDYLDALDVDYMISDDSAGKQDSQVDSAASGNLYKKLDRMFAYNQHHPKNLEFDGGMGEEELDEDYDDSSEDEDDYSLIAGSNGLDPDSGNHRGSERLHGLDYSRSFYSQPGSYKLQETAFEHSPYNNPTSEDLLNSKYIGLTDVSDDLNPFSDSTTVLRKINENSDNFGENLMKNLNRYNYDETWKEMKDKDLDRISGNGFESNSNSKINKRKINWRTSSKRNPLSEIGNRLYYASKSGIYDAKDLNDGSNQGTQSKTGRSAYYRLPKRNPMNAELRGTENEFEYESEGNGKHFTGNLLNGGKDNSDTTQLENSNDESNNEEEDGGTNKRNSENSDNVDDVKENLEDDGETVAEDNILENVIGKYIMRKSVKAGAFNGRDERRLSEDPIRHNLKKRSLEDILCDGHVPNAKVFRKRLSSGHLTESNFRKYHKKNFNKRKLEDTDKDADTNVTSNDIIKDEEEETGDVSEENDKENSYSKQVTLSSDENEVKRSALDIFKKITNKDKDGKKSDDLNIRTSGFEPILSSLERGVQPVFKDGHKDGYSSKKTSDINSKLLTEPKDKCTEDKKTEITHKTSSSEDGPWRIELKEKDDSKSSLTPGKNSEKKFKSTMTMKDRLTPRKTKQDLKTYIVFSNGLKAAKRNSETEEATAFNSGNPQEVDDYRIEAKEGAQQSEKDIWKRSSDQVQDGLNSEATNDISATATENSVSSVTSSLSDDLKAQPSQNSNKSGFVNDEAQVRHSDEKRKFFSNNGSSSGKSIFPIPNNANIIGDNVHLNEETSKYLGQQIVDAILAQATTDPRFKKFIAPGLSVKASHTRRRTQDDDESQHHKDYSDQVQTLMQTMMSDLEKLAEKHVKKRMCNQIDDQSKQFLHFLLDVPMDKITRSRQVKDETRPIRNMFKREESVPDQDSSNIPQSLNKLSNELKPTKLYQSEAFGQNDDEKSVANKKDAIYLMRKKYLLSQLLKNYQSQKDTDVNGDYSVKVRALADELDATNKELAAIDASVCGCQKKKKPPKCPSQCPSQSPSQPPAPSPCPPPPPPSGSCPAEKSLGFRLVEGEKNKPPANGSQGGTSERTTKEPADFYRFEPLVPLNVSDQILAERAQYLSRFGFEIVTTTQKKTENKTTPSPDASKTTKAPDFGKSHTNNLDYKLTSTKPFNLSSLDFPPTLSPIDRSLTFKNQMTPLPVDSKVIKDDSKPNLPFNLDGYDWIKMKPTSIPSLPSIPSIPSIGNTGPHFDKLPVDSTPRSDSTLSPITKSSQNTLNVYNSGPVLYHNQIPRPEYLEGGSFRRNFYDKNIIPTDKDDDSASRKIRRRSHNLLGKNRRSSRNIKTKRKSLRNLRQDQKMVEDVDDEKRKIRDLRVWWRPNSKRQNQRTYLARNRNEDDDDGEDDPGIEYLVWSSMPAVRRRLNNMEPDIDLDSISWPGLRRRYLRDGEERERRQPGPV